MAHELGMTVEHMCSVMTFKEYLGWIMYLNELRTPGKPPTIELASATAAELKGLF